MKSFPVSFAVRELLRYLCSINPSSFNVRKRAQAKIVYIAFTFGSSHSETVITSKLYKNLEHTFH